MDVASMLAAGPASSAQLVGLNSHNGTQTPDVEPLPASVPKPADHSHPNQQEQRRATSGDQGEANPEKAASTPSPRRPLLTAKFIPRGPPPRSVARAGERALRQIGLIDPSCPSVNLTPWFCSAWEDTLIPGSLEYYGRQAHKQRAKARRWVRKINTWAQVRDTCKSQLKLRRERTWPNWTVAGAKRFRKQTKSQYRQAKKKVNLYTERMLSSMTKVYTFAVRATQSESFWELEHMEHTEEEEAEKYDWQRNTVERE